MDATSLNQHISEIATCWDVLRDAHEATAQQREIARTWFLERYAGPVRRYLTKAVGVDAAVDLTEEFVTRFLEGRYRKADPTRGRFRDYLKTSLFHLVTDYRRAQAKDKTAQMPEHGWDPADPHDSAKADEEYWKQSCRAELIERSLRALEAEEQRRDHYLYTVLRFRLDHPDMRSPEAAQMLSTQIGKPVNDAWFRRRLMEGRERFAMLLLELVAESLDNPGLDHVQDELADLGLLEYCAAILDRLQR